MFNIININKFLLTKYPTFALHKRKHRKINTRLQMDYPSKKYATQPAVEAKLDAKAKQRVGQVISRSKVLSLLAGTFLVSWIYLSHLSDGLFMREACLAGVIICFLMIFKGADQ
ncbi:MAG TPA: hypothetical protein VJ953_02370 [Saprospiraceae bacterium]|nr:hypothetical protein [Saprospiraceae bacterium]